jgi:hypothetical protein
MSADQLSNSADALGVQVLDLFIGHDSAEGCVIQ